MRVLSTWVLGTFIAIAALAAPAHAQVADAIGKPLPRGDLDTGTVQVRVVEGDMGKPVASADVRLTIQGGDPRAARTDATGRTTFIGLAPRSRVSVATDGKEGEVKSVEFEVPVQGGVAVLLSTVPFDASSMGGGAPGGAMGGMPEPRKMAGQPRPEQNDPAGQLTVRLSYNDMTSMEGLADVPVVLVAYAADGRVAAKVARTDASGRVIVPNLDVSGDTAYYALSMLPRGESTDRLMSMPISPVAEMGTRLMLSGEKRDSGAPRVDDVERFIRQPNLPAGQVLIAVGGEMLDQGTVELVEIGTQEVIATAPLGRGRAIPDSIDATFGDLTPSETLPAGVIEVTVVVAAGGQKLGLPRAPVTVRSAGGGEAYTATLQSDGDGKVTIPGAPKGKPLEAVVEVQGRTFVSTPFTLAADKGATIEAQTRFELLSLVEAAFEGVPSNPEGAYLAQLKVGDELYRTPPFQVPAERGVVAPMFVMPRVELTFQLDVRFEDDYLASSGTFIVQNASWAPYAATSEGLRIPAPRGATGLVVAETDEHWVAADGDAFRLTRAVPPLGGDFRAGFSIPVSSDRVTFDLPLPLGSARSSLAIRMSPDMKVDLPKGVTGRMVPQPNGITWYAIQRIDIPANQRMVFDISGLPQRPAWLRWSRRFVGAIGIVMLIGGVILGVWMARGRRTTVEATTRKDRKRRIERLLDEVAAIERGQGDPARRDAAIAELEELYRNDAAAPGA